MCIEIGFFVTASITAYYVSVFGDPCTHITLAKWSGIKKAIALFPTIVEF
jgi:hypothetical protein